MGVVSLVCGSQWGKGKSRADAEFYFNFPVTVTVEIFLHVLRMFTYNIVDILQMCILSRFS